MKNVMIAGAGKIGAMVSCLLAESGEYQVMLVDLDFKGDDIARLIAAEKNIKTFAIDISDKKAMSDFITKNPQEAIVSCLPYFLNIGLAELAKDLNLHYFDLTEDTQVTAHIAKLAEGSDLAFVPQCGLAPGFISIVANSLMKEFTKVESAELRVGALPQNSNNALQYALTWSTDGLINEYGNPCHAIAAGESVSLHPLEGLEAIQIDGLSYEAFNTSGGLGSLVQTWDRKLDSLNYKTIRYPGHCEKMKVLMNDLKLNEDRDTLKRILENSIPKTYQDVVLLYVAVTGKKEDTLLEKTFVKKIYPKKLAGFRWSAIQLTTASGLCTVIDLVLNNPQKYSGMVLQEDFTLHDFLENQFGKMYS